MKQRINRNAWSEKSKRSYAYEMSDVFYEDIHFKCIKCKCNATFTAQEQKEAYEIKKQYISQKRKLCQQCFEEMLKLTFEIRDYQKRWASEPEANKSSATYLNDWHSALISISHYGKRKNYAIINMLSKYIDSTVA